MEKDSVVKDFLTTAADGKRYKTKYYNLDVIISVGYPTLEEKAAHLLYFVTKNHSFLDGNKRIAATMFLYFLDKNGVLFAGGEKLIDDHTLVALTIMIAESKPEEKDMMITVIMNCLKP